MYDVCIWNVLCMYVLFLFVSSLIIISYSSYDYNVMTIIMFCGQS